MFIGYAASFVSAPIVLSGLGLRAFGIWALTGALAQYGSLLDLGLGRAMSRYIATFDAAGDQRGVGAVMVIGLAASSLVFVPLIGLAVIVAGPVAGAIHGISTENIRTLLVYSACMAGLGMLTGAFAAWPNGLQRMVAPNFAIAGGGVINFIFSVGSIALGAHLLVYALANVIASVLSLLVVVGVIVATQGRPPLARPDRALVRELLPFALKGQVVNIADLVNYQSDKIIIALTVGPAAAGAYDIANRVCSAARAVGVFAQSALGPVFAATAVESGVQALSETYERFTQRAATIAFPALFLCAAAAPLLLAGWLGRIPPDGTIVLIVLSVAYVANVSTGVSYSLASATDAVGLPARSSTITAVANLALTAALAPLFGIWGVLSGTFIALTAGAILQVFLVQRRFSIPQGTHWNAVKQSLTLSALTAIPVAAVAWIARTGVDRVLQLAILVVCGAAYFTVYAGLASARDLLPSAINAKVMRARVLLLR